jgi:SAM-dependent methyltransferase
MNIIPRSNREKENAGTYAVPVRKIEYRDAEALVISALESYKFHDPEEAHAIYEKSLVLFPDHEDPGDFWESGADKGFKDFFVWGHDHDFGFGNIRSGAMGSRHLEITAELISLGMLAPSLTGKDLLNIGCWTGGDQLILNALGAKTTAVEEHEIAASACEFLFSALNVCNHIIKGSAYLDDINMADSFDIVYCSGVIYHVTDPVLLLRILFCYLRVGGSIVLETKSNKFEGSALSYSGILEKGWNWYAPNEEVLFRWLVDAGFDPESVYISRRTNGRLLASAGKTRKNSLPESAGFSRPGSWLELEN